MNYDELPRGWAHFDSGYDAERFARFARRRKTWGLGYCHKHGESVSFRMHPLIAAAACSRLELPREAVAWSPPLDPDDWPSVLIADCWTAGLTFGGAA